MAITMQDIQNEGFEHSLRGYDVEQVDLFLERVAKEVDAMNKHIAELEIELKTSNDDLASAREQLSNVSSESAASPEELEQASLREKEIRAQLDVANERAQAATARAQEAEAQLAPLQEQLAEKSKLDSAIAEAFISAQRSAEQIKDDARTEGERIYRESEAKAREFIRESLAKKASVDSEIESLQASAQKFRTEYLDMIDRFTSQARAEFQNLPALNVTEDQIDAELPDIDAMSVPEVQSAPATKKLVDDDLPHLTTAQIPQINIPPIFPEDK